eukprot:comp22214_c0_seq1/m.52502 comp22214_c0_seq1/g.52502  ORF comp22214_c0_seq1/g.52502 comp22214_c0_seq1/m.52502 type:complete len:309 (+) comp22214_c0_seq1:334-1260(+)
MLARIAGLGGLVACLLLHVLERSLALGKPALELIGLLAGHLCLLAEVVSSLLLLALLTTQCRCPGHHDPCLGFQTSGFLALVLGLLLLGDCGGHTTRRFRSGFAGLALGHNRAPNLFLGYALSLIGSHRGITGKIGQLLSIQLGSILGLGIFPAFALHSLLELFGALLGISHLLGILLLFAIGERLVVGCFGGLCRIAGGSLLLLKTGECKLLLIAFLFLFGESRIRTALSLLSTRARRAARRAGTAGLNTGRTTRSLSLFTRGARARAGAGACAVARARTVARTGTVAWASAVAWARAVAWRVRVGS